MWKHHVDDGENLYLINVIHNSWVVLKVNWQYIMVGGVLKVWEAGNECHHPQGKHYCPYGNHTR